MYSLISKSCNCNLSFPILVLGKTSQCTKC